MKREDHDRNELSIDSANRSIFLRRQTDRCSSTEGHWYIDAIAIVPNFQRRGVGEAALRDVMDEAGRTPIRLSVLLTNRARGLYRRLGFRVIGGDRQRELMEWRAQPF